MDYQRYSDARLNSLVRFNRILERLLDAHSPHWPQALTARRRRVIENGLVLIETRFKRQSSIELRRRRFASCGKSAATGSSARADAKLYTLASIDLARGRWAPKRHAPAAAGLLMLFVLVITSLIKLGERCDERKKLVSISAWQNCERKNLSCVQSTCVYICYASPTTRQRRRSKLQTVVRCRACRRAGLTVFRQSYVRCVASKPRKTRNKYGKEVFQLQPTSVAFCQQRHSKNPINALRVQYYYYYYYYYY